MRVEEVRGAFDALMADAPTPLAAADRLCRACVELLDVDGASISVTDRGTTRGTFGSSSELSRRVDALQFTLGEGPCLDAVRTRRPVLVDDLGSATERRWPAFRCAALESGVRAVFALPVMLASNPVGALDLYKHAAGPLGSERLAGGLLAAEIAARPLLEVMSAQADLEAHEETEDGWDQLVSLERVEVYQATGMVIAALDVDATEALVRLRANAYARDVTASELAWEVLEGRVDLHADRLWGRHGPAGGDDRDR